VMIETRLCSSNGKRFKLIAHGLHMNTPVFVGRKIKTN
jgi:hypothetical protein